MALHLHANSRKAGQIHHGVLRGPGCRDRSRDTMRMVRHHMLDGAAPRASYWERASIS